MAKDAVCPERTEIRLGGSGGQGVVTAGYILGRAAIVEGKHAVLTKTYGPEIRGARVTADVVIAQQPIDYPMVLQPGILICMAQESYDRLGASLAGGGQIFVDEDLVKAVPTDAARVCAIKAQRLAEELGSRVVANSLLVGYMAAVTRAVGYEALAQAMRETIRARAQEINLRALQRGFELGVPV